MNIIGFVCKMIKIAVKHYQKIELEDVSQNHWKPMPELDTNLNHSDYPSPGDSEGLRQAR